MSDKIDITHTVALKNRPHPDARLIRDLTTGEAEWEGVPEPELVAPPPAPTPPLGYNVEADVLTAPEPEKVTHVHKPKTKKLHHG